MTGYPERSPIIETNDRSIDDHRRGIHQHGKGDFRGSDKRTSKVGIPSGRKKRKLCLSGSHIPCDFRVEIEFFIKTWLPRARESNHKILPSSEGI